MTRFMLLGLFMAAASAAGSTQDIGNSTVLSPTSAANATSSWTETHANSSTTVLAILNATVFNSSTNASSAAALSSPAYTAAIANFVRSVLVQLNSSGLSGVDLGNITDRNSQSKDHLATDLLIQLLDGEGAAAHHDSVNRSQFSAPLNASINATALALAALSTISNETIDSLRDNSEDITFESLGLQDHHGGVVQQVSSPDSSGSRQTDEPIALERVAMDNSQARAISHALAGAVEAALAAEAEAARESATQFRAAALPAAMTATTTTTTFSAAAETASGDSGPSTFGVWIPTVAAVSAVVVLIGAALFTYQNRRQRGYNALSPGSMRLAQLTPPRTLE